jgi:hypothetical protein
MPPKIKISKAASVIHGMRPPTQGDAHPAHMQGWSFEQSVVYPEPADEDWCEPLREHLLQLSAGALNLCIPKHVQRTALAVAFLKGHTAFPREREEDPVKHRFDAYPIEVDAASLAHFAAFLNSTCGHNCSGPMRPMPHVSSLWYLCTQGCNGLQSLLGWDNRRISGDFLIALCQQLHKFGILKTEDVVTNSAYFMQHKITVSQHNVPITTAASLFCENFYSVPYLDIPRDQQRRCYNSNIDLATVLVPLSKDGMFLRLCLAPPPTATWMKGTFRSRRDCRLYYIPYGKAMILPTSAPYTTLRSSFTGNPYLAVIIHMSHTRFPADVSAAWQYYPQIDNDLPLGPTSYSIDLWEDVVTRPAITIEATNAHQNKFYNNDDLKTIAKLLFY